MAWRRVRTQSLLVGCSIKGFQIKVERQKVQVSGTHPSKDSDSPKPGRAWGCTRRGGTQAPLALLAACPHTTGTRVREKGHLAVKRPAAPTPSPTGAAWNSFRSRQPDRGSSTGSWFAREDSGKAPRRSRGSENQWRPACWTAGSWPDRRLQDPRAGVGSGLCSPRSESDRMWLFSFLSLNSH